jgi:hypothetical protein
MTAVGQVRDGICVALVDEADDLVVSNGNMKSDTAADT